KRVLDVGCGGGILAEAMAARGAEVTGIDLSEKSLRVAELHLLSSKARVVYEPSSVVAACAQLARPGGHVFFSTINRNPKAYLFAVIGAEYVLRLLPRGTHDYDRFIKPSELSRWAREAGLRPTELVGMTYIPLSKQYRLEADCDVNYLLRCARD